MAWVKWGYAPAEFWRTHPTVFWWTFEALMEKKHEAEDTTGYYAGNLTQGVVDMLEARLEE